MLFLAILILITSLAIAGVAAYFSVIGLALLFVGSGQSIIVMGTALEVGKLIVVSFLHQYWEKLNFLLKTYLTIATLLLMAITSIGIYGYLSNGYSATSNKVREIEQQINFSEIQIKQYQAENEKLSKFEFVTVKDTLITNKNIFINQKLDLIKQKETRIAAERITAEQEKKKIIEEQNNAKIILDSEINKEVEQIKIYNTRLEILDREVQTWLDQGTGGLFKANGIEKARQVKQAQEKERAQIDELINLKQKNIEKLREDYSNRIDVLRKNSDLVTNTLNANIKQLELEITKEKLLIEEYQNKTDRLLAEQDVLKETKQNEAKEQIKVNETNIQKLLSGISTLQGKILETDVGTFKFVAKSLNTELDKAVNWFIWIIMLVFDPLAVSLVICFNFLIKQRKPKASSQPSITSNPELPKPAESADTVAKLTTTTLPSSIEPQQSMATNTSAEILTGQKKIKQPPPKEGEVARLEKILEEQRKERETRKPGNN